MPWVPFLTNQGAVSGRLPKHVLCVEEGYRWLPKRQGCPGQRYSYTRVLQSLGRTDWQQLQRGGFERPVGRRQPVIFHAPDIIKALDELVEPTTRGDPESPLR